RSQSRRRDTPGPPGSGHLPLGKSRSTTSPTATVVSVPMGANHGQAITNTFDTLEAHTDRTTRNPTATPVTAARDDTGRGRLPSANRPRITPVVNPATLRAAFTMASMLSVIANSATAIFPAPTTTVIPRDTER